jgi:hypothetical protein
MTLQQLDKWLDWISDYCDKVRIDSDIFGGIPCNEDGSCEPDEATYICVQVYDVYGFTDFDILRESLYAVGVDYSDAEYFTGEGSFWIYCGFRQCKVYGFNIPLTK